MAAIKIKLVVDRSCNRVLFADIGSDFVDVLLAFLTLPISAVQLAAGASSPGCLTNLSASVRHLGDAKLLKGEACHGTLLRPTHADEFGYSSAPCPGCTPFKEKHPTPQGQHLQQCGCRCREVMARLAHVCDQTTRTEVFSKWKERFVISDDLVIKPAATSTVLSFLQGLYGDRIKDAYEVEVDVGWTQVVCLLKACVSSTTIFTDVFLAKRTDALMGTSVLTIHSPRRQETNQTPDPQMSIKLFFDKEDRKVMYAECKHDFVDLLLSFLTYPMGCILKNLAGTSHRTLLDPNIAPLKMHGANWSDQAIAEWYHLCRTGKRQCSPAKDKRSCHLFDPVFVDDHTYVVADELSIHQAPAVSVLKHWCKRNRDNVVEMDISAVALLRAVINSETVLSDAFKERFEQEAQPLPPSKRRTGSPSVEKMQIFVKIFTGETITLDMASSDTVAAVRSKIQMKGKPMADCGLVYGGKCLQDPWTLADCGIHREATIHLEFYPRGLIKTDTE
ncbi:hypothetical protein CFC21_059444 [Triticum aestivum]|uniref:Ubiquitin-like domain-containing protein n=2 Tax=Triticum aestivum TaxID=4565 RepID=A0A3B6IZG5_WHEAT|nr:hypothetical protein CFC21_059444 [Triticum aestivum]